MKSKERIQVACRREACGHVQMIRQWKGRKRWQCSGCGLIQELKQGDRMTAKKTPGANAGGDL